MLATLGTARVPAGKVYTAKDIDEDPHYRARDMILSQATRDGYELDVPGVVPKLSATPGTVRTSAPHLGDDTDAVLAEIGFSDQDIAALRGKEWLHEQKRTSGTAPASASTCRKSARATVCRSRRPSCPPRTRSRW